MNSRNISLVAASESISLVNVGTCSAPAERSSAGRVSAAGAAEIVTVSAAGSFGSLERHSISLRRPSNCSWRASSSSSPASISATICSSVSRISDTSVESCSSQRRPAFADCSRRSRNAFRVLLQSPRSSMRVLPSRRRVARHALRIVCSLKRAPEEKPMRSLSFSMWSLTCSPNRRLLSSLSITKRRHLISVSGSL